MSKSKQQSKPMRAGRTRSEQKTRRRDIIRKTVSMVILLLCWVPMLGGGVQPLWVIPAVVCVCMNEDLYFCWAAGTVAGFGIDLACGSALGANAIYLVLCSTLICLLFEQILRRSFWHFLILTAACVFLRAGLSYLCGSWLFRTPGRELLWEKVLLPSSVWTLIVAVPVYLLYLPCARLLTKRVRSMDAAAIRRDW